MNTAENPGAQARRATIASRLARRGLWVAATLPICLILGGLTRVAVATGHITPNGALEKVVNVALGLGAGVGLAASIVATILVLAAQRSLLRALAALGVRTLDPGPVWATWSWFVPVANLIVPARSLRQVARAAHGEARKPLDRLLCRWWLLWLAAVILALLTRPATWAPLVTNGVDPQRLAELAVVGAGVAWALALANLATALPLLAAHLAETAMLVTASSRLHPLVFSDVTSLVRWHDETLGPR